MRNGPFIITGRAVDNVLLLGLCQVTHNFCRHTDSKHSLGYAFAFSN